MIYLRDAEVRDIFTSTKRERRKGTETQRQTDRQARHDTERAGGGGGGGGGKDLFRNLDYFF